MHMPSDLSNFGEMHLFPDWSGLFSKKKTLGAELSFWWQTDLFLEDPLCNKRSDIFWYLIFIRFCPFFEISCPLEYWTSEGDILQQHSIPY